MSSDGLNLLASVALLASSPTLLSNQEHTSLISGQACTPETHISRQVGDGGRPYISGYGKAVCPKGGPGRITVVLYEESREMARKTIDSNATNYISAVSVPCVDGATTVDWILVAQYSDDLLGQTMQHAFLKGSHCKAP